jgi:hypothetical protein
VSARNRPQNASSGQDRDGRLYLLMLFLLIAAYAVIGYGVYKVIDALA